MDIYAGLVGIPFLFLYKYIHPNKEKRQILGDGEEGRPKILEEDDV